MMLKYYLRGLGMGILVTALILGLTGNPEMTDVQIRERALELGMVDKTNMTLSEVRTEEATVSEEEEESDDVSTSDSEVTGDESVTSGEEETEEADASVGQEETEEADTSAGQEETGSESISTAGEETTAPVTITIVRGDSSVSVSRDLAEAGLVDSAKAFDAYLCGNGYDKRISVGNFQIYPGSTYEEIAKIISRSK